MNKLLAGWRPSLALLAGLTITLALFAASLFLSYAEHDEQYRLETQTRLYQLTGRVQNANTAITTLATLFSAAQYVDADQFRLFTGSLMQQYAFLRAALYAPRIRPQDRADYELAVAEEGLPGFRIQGRSGPGAHFPVRFLEPYTPLSTRWLGLDLSGQPVIAGALRQTPRAGGARIAIGTGPFGSDTEYWLLMPLIGHHGQVVPEPDGEIITGVVGLALDPGALAEGLIGPGERLRLHLAPDAGQGYATPVYEAGLPATDSRFRLRNGQELPLAGARLLIEFERDLGVPSLAVSYGLTALTLGLVVTALFLALAYKTNQRQAALAEAKHGQQETNAVNLALQLNDARLNALLDLSTRAPVLTERELLQHGLEEAERLTGSAIAYLHFINDDQQSIQLYTWSRNTLELCQSVPDKHYLAGILADTVRLKEPCLHNDYPGLTGRHGHPEGHMHLVRHLATPVLEGDQVRLVIGVGNKPEAYDDSDLRQLQLIGEGLWRIVGLRRAQAELEAARDAAETANRAKSIFLANMSHELRTPLNAILGFAQLMERDARIPEDQGQNLATINKSGQHLLGLINDVLEISRIESGRLSLNPVNIDLAELLETLVDVMQPRARNKGLGLRLERSPGLPAGIAADLGKLRQILTNLLSNAIKYTEHGEVVLRARLADPAADPKPAEGQEPDLVNLVFEVADTGVGIAPEHLEAIFQPFYQTEYGVRLGEGTGLGLAICREYARLMGAPLSAESRPGRGSCFRLSLAVPRVELGAPERPARGQVLGLAAGQAAYRVLVAEDNPDSQRLIVELLRLIGFRMQSAANGEEAVKACERELPDLVIMDMRMPVMDGYQATRAIRALPGGARLPILALTASAFEEDRAAILAAGCSDIEYKPIQEERLLAAIARLLGANYVYQAPDRPALLESAPGADLPAELLERLRAAAEALDPETVRACIDEVRAHSEAAAEALAELARDYRFDRILAWCQDVPAAPPSTR